MNSPEQQGKTANDDPTSGGTSLWELNGKMPQVTLTPGLQDTEIIVVVGPLGAGKTTFINQALLGEFRDMLGNDVSVLVNDIGEINVDSKRIRDNSDQVNALTTGCICCEDFATLKTAIERTRGRTNTIIVEPTGIANAEQVKQAFDELGLRPKIVCVLDVRNFDRNLALGTVDSQVRVADLIALSK